VKEAGPQRLAASRARPTPPSTTPALLSALRAMEPRELERMSVAEHVEFGRSQERRFEYAYGEAFAMAGASLRHNAIVFNVYPDLDRAKPLPTRARRPEC
jgi:hypothetical protein